MTLLVQAAAAVRTESNLNPATSSRLRNHHDPCATVLPPLVPNVVLTGRCVGGEQTTACLEAARYTTRTLQAARSIRVSCSGRHCHLTFAVSSRGERMRASGLLQRGV